MVRYTAVAVLGFLLVAGCGGEGSTGPSEDINLTGSWSGTSANATLTLDIHEASDGSITGSGQLSTTGFTEPFQVTAGEHDGSNVEMQLGDEGNYEGRVESRDVIDGSLYPPSGDTISFRLTR